MSKANKKQHKGIIKNWRRVECQGGLGYYIVGTFLDHPNFNGLTGHTSYVIAHDPNTHEIETLNSRYTLSRYHGD